MNLIKRLNERYLNLIYNIGTKLMNPLWMIMAIWIPLSIVVISIGYDLIDVYLLIKILTIMGIPVLYATFLVTNDIKIKKRKYSELEELGMKIFGDENKFRLWMNSSIKSLDDKKPIDVDLERAKEALVKIENDIF